MYIDRNGWIGLGSQDMPFAAKFGIEDATRMVLDFIALNPHLPFIFDTYQLAYQLGVSRKDLFALTRHASAHYRNITLKKKNGDYRTIHAPDTTLKSVQHTILRTVLRHPASRYATAYVRGRSLTDNASPHVGKRYILKLDITDFFGSIRFDQVYSAAFNTRYFPKQIGVMLTTLCCYRDVLPQGAPTSPALSNLVMKNFDENLGAWCEKRGITYTRYCDDMTFSGDCSLYPVYQKVKNMLRDTAFELNERKTHFITNAARQSVTGLTVNEKVAVSSDYKRRLRQEVHYLLKYGAADCLARLGDTETSPETYFNRLVGRLRFVLQIEPDNAYFRRALGDICNSIYSIFKT